MTYKSDASMVPSSNWTGNYALTVKMWVRSPLESPCGFGGTHGQSPSHGANIVDKTGVWIFLPQLVRLKIGNAAKPGMFNLYGSLA